MTSTINQSRHSRLSKVRLISLIVGCVLKIPDKSLDVQIGSPYIPCGICHEPFQETFSPISASLSANSSSRLSFGLRLPCPQRHSYCISCISAYIHHKLEADGKSIDTIVFPIRCPECPVSDWGGGIQDDVAQKILNEQSLLIWVRYQLITVLNICCQKLTSLRSIIASSWTVFLDTIAPTLVAPRC